MAAETVYKIQEAEEKGSEMIKNAAEEAKEIIRKAEIDGAEKRKAMIGEAVKTKEAMIKKAIDKATEDCADLTRQGDIEKEAILNPGDIKLESAAAIVIERIVNANGNR